MAAPRKENIKEIILDATCKLLETRSLADISLADISLAAGISKGTLYYHYKTKGEIFFDITDRYLSQQWQDFINWTDETVIDIRDFGGEFQNTTRAWAPEVLWDEKEQKYFVYWSNSTKENDFTAIYYAYTEDFKSLTYPKKLFERPGVQTIDADIILSPLDNLYYMYFKFEESQKIAYVTSKNLAGPYTNTPVIVSLASTGVEGSNIYRLDGTDRYIMIMDEYGEHRYFAQETKNFRDFTALPRESYTMDFSPRHGNVITVSDECFDALIEKFGI